MAISGSAQIVVRTDGNDGNGGGFVLGAAGTDYSNQASAQFSGTDLVVVGSTCTAASHSFVSTDVGNLIQAGGFFQIVSVTTGTATLDRTGATSGTWALGGALLTISQALTIPPVGGSGFGAGMIVAVKAGTYTITSTLLLPTASDGGLGPLSIIGFQSAPGDGGTRPIITTSTNSISLITLAAADVGITLENLEMSSTAGTPGAGLSAPTASNNARSVQVWSCRLHGFNVGILADFNVVYRIEGLSLFNTEVDHCVSHGVSCSGSTSTYNCKIHDNGGHGFDFGTNCLEGTLYSFSRTAFYLNALGALVSWPNSVLGASVVFDGCIFSDNTAAGVQYIPTGQALFGTFINCVFYNNGTYGFNYSTAGVGGIILQNCAFGANTTAATHNITTGLSPIALSGDPFTSRLTGDFSLNNTAGAGAALRGAGYPLYADVGALQHQDSGGGSTTVYVIAPQITQYLQEGS